MASLVWSVTVLFCILTWSQALGDNTNQQNNAVVTTEYEDTPQTYTELAPNRFTWNKYKIIATATATVVVVAGIIATASLLLPLIAYKICVLLGACDRSLNTYVDQFVARDANPRHKRSMEYLGPILQTLAIAYEKYGVDDTKKAGYTQLFHKIAMVIQIAPVVVHIVKLTFFIIHLLTQLYSMARVLAGLIYRF